jgi:signal transduction histidine kinase
VAERTDQLTASLDEARTAARMQQELLTGLAHELTTPLHAILGLLELVDREPSSEHNPHRLQQVGTSAKALAQVLDAVLSLRAADMPAAGDDLDERIPDDVIDELSSRWQVRLLHRGQLLTSSVVGGEEAVLLSWHRLLRAADVLLDNAERHAAPGVIGLELSVSDRAVNLTLTDEGPGLSDDQLAALFAPLDSGNERRNGIVNLSIARRLVENAGGAIEVSRRAESDGTVTTLVIPRPSSAPAAEHDHRVPPGSG